MLFLEHVRFINVGAPECRISDLTLSALDDAGAPVDTVIWLRNGGGKTALLGLFFAHLLPGARDFLKGKKDNARFSDHVLEGDTSFIAARWVGEPTDLPLGDTWGDGRPRLVTLRVVERKPGATGSDLPDRFFSFRPVPGVLDIDRLPWRTGDGRRDLSSFAEEMQRLAREHPELEMTPPFDADRAWMDSLRARGLDPEVFRYQLQMNAGEGEAATGFMQFRTSEEFVNFLIGVVTPVATLDALDQEMRTFAAKLRRRPDLERELELIERALPALRTHAAGMEAVARVEEERAAALVEAARLRAALAAAVRASQAEAEATAAALGSLKEEGEAVRGERELIGARLREVAYHVAVLEAAAAEQRLADAERGRAAAAGDVTAWKAAGHLAELRPLESAAAELARLLAVKEREAEPLRRARDRAGSALRGALERSAAAAEQDAARLAGAAEAQRKEAGEEQRAAEQCVLERSQVEREADEARRSLDRLDQDRKRLRGAARLGTGESAAAAVDRWEGALGAARRRLAEIEVRVAEVREARRSAGQERDRADRAVAAGEGELTQLQSQLRRLEAARRAILDDEALAAVWEAPEPDLWAAGDRLIGRLDGRAQELSAGVVRAELGAAADRRSQAALERSGTLPPSPDVERALEILAAANLHTAFAGWEYLRAAGPDRAAAMLVAAPELAGGLLLNDPGALDDVRAALERSGVRPTSVVTLGLAEAFDRPPGEGRLIWPPHSGLYDTDAARSEQVAVGQRLRDVEASLAGLRAELGAVQRLSLGLAAFLRDHPAGTLEQLEGGIEEVAGRIQDAKARVATLERTLADLDAEDGRLDQERGRCRKTVEDALEALPALRDVAGQEASEAAWRGIVGTAPERIDAVARRLRRHRERDQSLRAEAGRRDVQSMDHRRLAGDLRREAAGLPASTDLEPGLEGMEPDRLRRILEERAEVYRRRLGEDELGARQARVEAEMAAVKQRLARFQAPALSRARDLLATPLGATEESRERALADAEEERERTGAVAQRLRSERDARTREREQSERQRERLDAPMIVSDLAAGARLRESLTIQDRDAARRENSLNSRRGVVENRHHKARERALGLDSALSLLKGREDVADHAGGEGAAPYQGTPEDAKGDAAGRVEALQQLDRDARAGANRAAASAAALRRMGEDRRFERLGTRITTRVADPGDRAEHVTELAEELERRLPGLRSDLDSIESDRRMVVGNLIGAVRGAFRDLREIGNASRLPDGLGAWSSQPFVRISFEPPRADEEWARRLGAVVEDWIEREKIPANSGLALLRQALRAAAARGAGSDGAQATVRNAFVVTLLKPDANPTTQRHRVEDMKFSEGQDLTTAILLYCSFVNLRVQRAGDPGGAAGALVLDNPIGKASLEELIALQRTVAARMRVQLIATTGVKDREAISHYPRVIGIRPARSRDGRRRYLMEGDEGLAAAGLVRRGE